MYTGSPFVGVFCKTRTRRIGLRAIYLSLTRLDVLHRWRGVARAEGGAPPCSALGGRGLRPMPRRANTRRQGRTNGTAPEAPRDHGVRGRTPPALRGASRRARAGRGRLARLRLADRRPLADDEPTVPEQWSVARLRPQPDTWPDVPAVVAGGEPVDPPAVSPCRGQLQAGPARPCAQHLVRPAEQLDVVEVCASPRRPLEPGRRRHPRARSGALKRGRAGRRARTYAVGAVSGLVVGDEQIAVRRAVANAPVDERRPVTAVDIDCVSALLR